VADDAVLNNVHKKRKSILVSNKSQEILIYVQTLPHFKVSPPPSPRKICQINVLGAFSAKIINKTIKNGKKEKI
jgi:hypothetical protein